MLNSALVLAAAEEGHHVVNELPIPPVWFGIIVFLLLMAGLLAILSMRSVGLRHAEPTTAVQHHGTHGTGSHSAGH
ncbi:hypothetical protein KW076_09110 [Micrococcus porci]|uniref:hypothetical protein n=1 Tax=Micrococcus TaxID=1269 RepID=UPI001CCB4C36|nr:MULTISPECIES: hypothetical protein [Micrococcus]MCG7422005.1 hypothetical protein [Micrococcus sp. ACRRV]UBH24042.1 hypothetical protein KW076_09110 [Micrococcus porci]